MKYKIQFFVWLLAINCSIFADKFTLITVLYNETNAQRQQEYIYCLEKNLQHPSIEKIHILYDAAKDDQANELLAFLKTKPVEITYIQDRPFFGFCFDLANITYPNKKIIVCNGDIFFNQTLSKLASYDFTNKFLALTRWNVTESGALEIFTQYKPDGTINYDGCYLSQDAWLFTTPLKQFINPNFRMGTWACDGYIAYQAYISGLQVLNPCLTIQACHMHLSNLRTWIPQSIPGAKALILPWCNL